VRIAEILAQIRTEHFSNASQEGYSCPNRAGGECMRNVRKQTTSLRSVAVAIKRYLVSRKKLSSEFEKKIIFYKVLRNMNGYRDKSNEKWEAYATINVKQVFSGGKYSWGVDNF
jgi:hypothetical protein